MKTILRIIIILLVASVVAGGFYLAVNQTYAFDESGQPPAMTTPDGQSLQPMEGPERGDHEAGALAQGLSGLLTTTVKLAGITLLMLMLEKGFAFLSSRKWKFAHQSANAS